MMLKMFTAFVLIYYIVAKHFLIETEGKKVKYNGERYIIGEDGVLPWQIQSACLRNLRYLNSRSIRSKPKMKTVLPRSFTRSLRSIPKMKTVSPVTNNSPREKSGLITY